MCALLYNAFPHRVRNKHTDRKHTRSQQHTHTNARAGAHRLSKLWRHWERKLYFRSFRQILGGSASKTGKAIIVFVRAIQCTHTHTRKCVRTCAIHTHPRISHCRSLDAHGPPSGSVRHCLAPRHVATSLSAQTYPLPPTSPPLRVTGSLSIFQPETYYTGATMCAALKAGRPGANVVR